LAPALGDETDGRSASGAWRVRAWARAAAADADAPLAVRRFRDEAVLERAD
jgi:hypothetical protein